MSIVNRGAALLTAAVAAGEPAPPGPGDLVQVWQDLGTNPGWDAVGNRIEAIDPPTITQDFGRAKTDQWRRFTWT